MDMTVLQFLAITADQEEAIVGPGPVKDDDGEDLANIDQMHPGQKGHEGQQF